MIVEVKRLSEEQPAGLRWRPRPQVGVEQQDRRATLEEAGRQAPQERVETMRAGVTGPTRRAFFGFED